MENWGDGVEDDGDDVNNSGYESAADLGARLASNPRFCRLRQSSSLTSRLYEKGTL